MRDFAGRLRMSLAVGGPATGAALRHLLSHHRALFSSYRHYFESQPILPGEFQCFRLYHSATETEGFLPAETLVALGTRTLTQFRVRRIQAVHILDQTPPAGARLACETHSL